jgi:subtilase family serine protease
MSTTAENEANAARILHIAVKQRNEDLLEKLLFSVSTPSSPKYGQHLSLAEVCSNFSPESKHISAIEQVSMPQSCKRLVYSNRALGV